MKLWGGRFRQQENKMMEDFNSSFPFDYRLYEQDLIGSLAHVVMLGNQGILTREETETIMEGLTGILEDISEGVLELSAKAEDAEDIHTFVEVELIRRAETPDDYFATLIW